MQKWEYGVCKVWDGYVISEKFPDRDGGKIKVHAELEAAHIARKWKFKGDETTFYDLCNERGADGWELVAFSPTSLMLGAHDAIHLSQQVLEMRALFKRPKG
jgi:hypothetical protein